MQEQYGRDRSRTKDVTGQVSVIRHHSASWGPLSASVDWVLDTPAATTGASDERRESAMSATRRAEIVEAVALPASGRPQTGRWQLAWTLLSNDLHAGPGDGDGSGGGAGDGGIAGTHCHAYSMYAIPAPAAGGACASWTRADDASARGRIQAPNGESRPELSASGVGRINKKTTAKTHNRRTNTGRAPS